MRLGAAVSVKLRDVLCESVCAKLAEVAVVFPAPAVAGAVAGTGEAPVDSKGAAGGVVSTEVSSAVEVACTLPIVEDKAADPLAIIGRATIWFGCPAPARISARPWRTVALCLT